MDDNTLLLRQVVSLLSPDNRSLMIHKDTEDIRAGQAIRVIFPPWTRRWSLNNLSSTSGTAGNLYFWFDSGKSGTTQLPEGPNGPAYRTLVGGDFESEESQHKTIFIMADPTATDQEWELHFSGRED